MTTTQMRTTVVELMDEAVKQGARREKACQVMGLDSSTLRRWRPAQATAVQADQRPLVERPAPRHKLSEAECELIVATCHQLAYASLAPSQIVPKLADQGQYIASESSFYRILRARGLLQHRGRARRATRGSEPVRHTASRSNEIWTYDITYLPGKVRGQFYYLYMIQDLYSRYGVHWEVHDCESGEHNASLIQQAILKAGCGLQRPILHSDNGSPMKALTMRTKLVELGITPSHSRPSVSNDNAFIESMFRTVKYCPQWPSAGFKSLDEARTWTHRFMQWYNHEHQHSGIKYVTPAERYAGDDAEILARRTAVYAAAKARNPSRWSGDIRDWTPVEKVELNPEKGDTAQAESRERTQKAA